jgi:hypothetical protein
VWHTAPPLPTVPVWDRMGRHVHHARRSPPVGTDDGPEWLTRKQFVDALQVHPKTMSR